MLKRDFSERNMGQGPAAKRRDSAGAQGRLDCHTEFFVHFKINTEICR